MSCSRAQMRVEADLGASALPPSFDRWKKRQLYNHRLTFNSCSTTPLRYHNKSIRWKWFSTSTTSIFWAFMISCSYFCVSTNLISLGSHVDSKSLIRCRCASTICFLKLSSKPVQCFKRFFANRHTKREIRGWETDRQTQGQTDRDFDAKVN